MRRPVRRTGTNAEVVGDREDDENYGASLCDRGREELYEFQGEGSDLRIQRQSG